MRAHNDYRSVNIYQYCCLNVLKLDVNKKPSILCQRKMNPDLHFHSYLLFINSKATVREKKRLSKARFCKADLK